MQGWSQWSRACSYTDYTDWPSGSRGYNYYYPIASNIAYGFVCLARSGAPTNYLPVIYSFGANYANLTGINGEDISFILVCI